MTGAFRWYWMPDNQTHAEFLTRREKLIQIDCIRGNFRALTVGGVNDPSLSSFPRPSHLSLCAILSTYEYSQRWNHLI